MQSTNGPSEPNSTPTGRLAPQIAKNSYEWQHLFSLSGVSAAMTEFSGTRMQYTRERETDGLGQTNPAPYALGDKDDAVGIAGFPTIFSYQGTAGDFGFGGAAGATAVVGIGSSSQTMGTYFLEIPKAEYATLPFFDLQRLTNDTSAKQQTLISNLNTIISSSHDQQSNAPCLRDSLSVVGSAFYTRQLTVTMADSYANALAARASFRIPEDSSRQAVINAVGKYVLGDPDAQLGTSIQKENEVDPSADSNSTGLASKNTPSLTKMTRAEIAAEIQPVLEDIYERATRNSKPGVTGFTAGYSKTAGEGISLDYKYPMPVAFGVRLYPVMIRESDGRSTLFVMPSSLPFSPGLTEAVAIPAASPGVILRD